MSNYPAGVTGHEYAIAGPDYEKDEYRECGTADVELTLMDDAARNLVNLAMTNAAYIEGWLGVPGNDVGSALAQVKVLRTRLATLANLPTTYFGECPFAGEVTVLGYQGNTWWTCPVCGAEHEAVVDEGPDPDDQRDMLIEQGLL